MSRKFLNAILNIPAYRAWYETNHYPFVFLFEEDESGKAYVSVVGLKAGRASIEGPGSVVCHSVPREFLFFVGGGEPTDF
jgi:hypothetical protein